MALQAQLFFFFFSPLRCDHVIENYFQFRCRLLYEVRVTIRLPHLHGNKQRRTRTRTRVPRGCGSGRTASENNASADAVQSRPEPPRAAQSSLQPPCARIMRMPLFEPAFLLFLETRRSAPPPIISFRCLLLH